MSSGISGNRVLFVSTQMEAGGVQVLATGMTSAFLSNGADAAVAFLYKKRPVFDGAPGVLSLFPRKPGPLGCLLIIFRLLMLVLRYKPTVIVGMAHYSSPLACIVGLICGVPNRIATQTSRPASVKWIARGLDIFCGTLGIYTANVAASKTIERELACLPARYRASLRTIYNGVSLAEVRCSKEEARASFGLRKEGFLLVTCGRLAPVKNHIILLDSLVRLPDVHLAILGEGELRSHLENEIERRNLASRVTLLGEAPPSTVATFLACGDAFVFPSRHEAFGMAVAEAMLARLPVLATNYPAVAEVVGDAGFLIDCDDVDEWVRCVNMLQLDDALRASMVARSDERGRCFSFDSMFLQFQELIANK